MLDRNTENNTVLIEHLERLKDQNKELHATVLEVQSKNADYIDELDVLTTSLEELMDQNSEHETQARQLSKVNDKLRQELTLFQQKNTALLETVESLKNTIDKGNEREAQLAEEK